MNLKDTDTQIYKLIKAEKKQQLNQIRLIPSENYTSKAVQEAVGSVLMNKYSEGQVGKRYYQANNNIDKIETLAKSRALELFKLDPQIWDVNVQAVIGSIANLAVYGALLQPQDKILSMALTSGGHLSHGWQISEDRKVSFTSKVYQPNYYETDPSTQLFNYDKIQELALQIQPKIIISGGTGCPRQINFEKLSSIAKKVGAYYMADVAHESGLIAGGFYDSPFKYADIITMTTRKTLRGPIGALIFSKKELSEKIDKAIFPGLQGGPQNHSIAGIAVCLQEALKPEFKIYVQQIVKNAKTLANALIEKGYKLITNGTDNHLMLIDLTPLNTTGTIVANALENANIIVNKNTIPNSSAMPWNPTGIRLGTPAITTLGAKENHMIQIAQLIDKVIKNINDKKVIKEVKEEVKEVIRDIKSTT